MAKRTSIYDHQAVESRWLAQWQEWALFQDTDLTQAAAKDYLLFAFAYPSGAGLHVGHVESKTALDILARFRRMHGRAVFFPVGWDAFGLPAENYAIKTGIHPAVTTKNAIDTFRRQIQRLGISYDWTNELATNHPQYYRWTQWIFLQLFKAGLAYQKQGKVNWCPSCQTVLANEQVVEGHCERCESQVVQKDLKQWYFKITDYQDELIEGLEEVDWPTATKQQQLHWIGRSQGAEVDFLLTKTDQAAALTDRQLSIFTTRLDTIYGTTFMVISPEKYQELKLAEVVPADRRAAVEAYLEQAFAKTEEDRKIGEKDKTGVETGLLAINPFNEQLVPVFVADYVLAGYGTGAIMGVPAHDQRDLAFAQKFKLPVVEVVDDQGKVINSGEFNGLTSQQAVKAMLAKLPDVARASTNYKLRDWLISRQRYWGTPIPIVYDPEGQAHPVKEEHLPWLLPTDVDFKPTGESPLRSSQEFKERVERLYGPGWTPEYDTMDTFVDSSWYFLRYVDSRNPQQLADPQRLEEWLPVDLYLIGPEHIVLHLLYSRFFTKFLRDRGYLQIDEPFAKMRHQGMILGPDGKKMSKSKGNVINPDQVIERYGADTLRVYEMFMGPLEADKPWDTRAVAGVARFLNKIYRLSQQEIELIAQLWPLAAEDLRQPLIRKLHQTIRKVSKDIPRLKFNTAIASLMELMNLWEKQRSLLAAKRAKQDKNLSHLLSATELISLWQLLAPLAPFISEELYGQAKYAWQNLADQTLGEIKCETAEAKLQRQTLEAIDFTRSIHFSTWPVYDEQLAQAQELKLAVQINGKVRAQLTVDAALVNDQQAVLSQTKGLESVQKWLIGHHITQEIYVPGKIVSLVTD